MYDEQTSVHAGSSGGTSSGASAEAVSVHDLKRAVRREKIALRRAMSAELRSRADEAINRRLLEIVRTEKPSGLVAYVSDGTEPDLSPVMRYALQAGITLCLPRFEQSGAYSIVTVRSLDFPALLLFSLFNSKSFSLQLCSMIPAPALEYMAKWSL